MGIVVCSSAATTMIFDHSHQVHEKLSVGELLSQLGHFHPQLSRQILLSSVYIDPQIHIFQFVFGSNQRNL